MEKIFVIGDIHGCIHTFIDLLGKMNVSKKDTLVLLGDYIDKGPFSKKVLDYLIYKLPFQCELICLRGNHEELLEVNIKHRNETPLSQMYDTTEFTIFTDKNNIATDYGKWLKELHLYYAIQDFIFVHAGINLKASNPFAQRDFMLNNYSTLGRKTNKRIFHGHFITPKDKIYKLFNGSASVIPVDNGCYLKDQSGFGHLVGLELTASKIFISKNMYD